MLDFPEFIMNVHVRYAEVGPTGKARLSAVADWFQEAAGLNADELGFGDEMLFRHGITWILTKMIFYIKKMPSVGQELQVRTWPSRMEHLAHRGYELLDEEGTPIICATGAWAVMDLQTRKIIPMPQSILSVYPKQTITHVPFASTVTPRLRNPDSHESPILVRHDDLDMNGHVNNARYLGWLLEPVVPDNEALSMLEVSFRAECFPGDALRSRCSPKVPAQAGDETERIHAIVRESASCPGRETDVCRALTRWRFAEENGQTF